MAFDVIIGRNRKDVEKFGKKGTILMAKQYVKMGQTTSLSNPVYMDIAGAHVVFIVGKRGTGKCVLGNTFITLNNYQSRTIEEIYSELKENAIIVTKNHQEELLKPTHLLKVLSVDSNLNFIERPIQFIYRKQVKENLIKLTLSSKKEVIVTKEHPLLVQVNVQTGELLQCLWKKAGALQEGEEVMVKEGTAVTAETIKSVKKITYDGWVYDLTIPETHNFIGNGIVCHNSYTLGGIAEGLSDLPLEIKQNLSILLVDTMGIYWTMKYPNFQDAELARQWGFEPKGLDVKIYTPAGFFAKFKEEGIPTDYPFSIRPLDVGPEDWCRVFAINPNSAEGVLLSKVVEALGNKGESYTMDQLIQAVKADEESEKITKSIVMSQFEKAKDWGVFSTEGTPLKDLVSGGQVTILDISPYATVASGWDIKALVTGLVCRTLFNQRMLARKAEEFQSVDQAMHYFSREVKEKMEEPLVWIAIDEAHELLPREGKTAASDALITILREGRQPGISLILATQQPAKIHTDVMTQADTVIAHRLTAQMDIEALGSLMQSYMRKGLDQELSILPPLRGAALIFDDANERMFPVQMRPRFTWHGGSSPTAIKEKKEFFREALEKIKDL
ncbi:MAG: zonular occludens toxin domain-containing protein [Nanoarchaeota archaeon]